MSACCVGSLLVIVGVFLTIAPAAIVKITLEE